MQQQIYSSNSERPYPLQEGHGSGVPDDMLVDISLTVPVGIVPVITAVVVNPLTMFIAIEDSVTETAVGQVLISRPSAFTVYQFDMPISGAYGWVVPGPGCALTQEYVEIAAPLDASTILKCPTISDSISSLSVNGELYPIGGLLGLDNISAMIDVTTALRSIVIEGASYVISDLGTLLTITSPVNHLLEVNDWVRLLNGDPQDFNVDPEEEYTFYKVTEIVDSKVFKITISGLLDGSGTVDIAPNTPKTSCIVFSRADANLDQTQLYYGFTESGAQSGNKIYKIAGVGPDANGNVVIETEPESFQVTTIKDRADDTEVGLLFNQTNEVCKEDNPSGEVKHGRCQQGINKPLPCDPLVEEKHPEFVADDCGCGGDDKWYCVETAVYYPGDNDCEGSVKEYEVTCMFNAIGDPIDFGECWVLGGVPSKPQRQLCKLAGPFDTSEECAAACTP